MEIKIIGGLLMLFGFSNYLAIQMQKIMDGGRLKWEKEERELTRDVSSYAETSYQAPERE